ncbi:hypothetical protein GNI_055440 [Gregarina niphandrodes]|uniref:Uncharacterized protein n=1 Tax=Gregarina niphandrodes TaxID=110365 RepID=A0A023B8X7_GRENI|nr:hypothetical protein GNI_055440 [Gregarina niphandrodes]EZG70509.1 hypothetical protein GNI_055440 [Gregarina niphandrodes]|eukprot:XP_011129929.1 hypothetical protein GNI_055440 [Gregarina niphandrodes]
MDLALLLTLHIVPSLHEDRSVDRLVQKEMSSVVGMQRQRLEVLEEQLACSVDVNGRFLEALAVLDWLRRPADLAPMVGALLRAALGRSDTVQREAVGVVRRLLMRRRTPSDGIVGVKNTLEGFIEEHAHEIIARCPFTMQRVADTLSRILSGGAPEESRPHIILAVIPPVTSEDKAVLIGYLPCASKTRPNRLGIGLQHILRDRLGCDAVSHNGFASYIVRVRGESGRKAFQLLFPRKRSRRSSQQGRRGKRPKQRENSDPQADGNSSQGEVGKQADEIRDAVF